MTLVRQRTVVRPPRHSRGKGRPQPSRKRGTRNMRKTTKKGAYRKNKVKAWVNRQRPLVETKKRELAELGAKFSTTVQEEIMDPTIYQPLIANSIGNIKSTGVFSLLQLQNFTSQYQLGNMAPPHGGGSQGDDNSNEMVGTNLFGRYLNVKGIVRWPLPANTSGATYTIPQKLEIVWGWCPPINATGNTTPAVQDVKPSLLTAHVVEQIGEYFNSSSDQLRYISKREQNVKILGRRTMKPRWGDQYQPPTTMLAGTTGPYASGITPDAKFSVSFKLFKKFHYEQGDVITNSALTFNKRTFNLVDQWIPFVVFYQPEENQLYPDDELLRPQVAYNSMFYYSDQ